MKTEKKTKAVILKGPIKLTPENYHSPEANWAYMSSSQYKKFAGTKGQKGCEACAMAELRGEWKQEKTTALLVGSYVDSYFEGSLDLFKRENPEIFKKDGELCAPFMRAKEVIARIEKDKLFMLYLAGDKQVIYTAQFFGAWWKIKVDSLDKCVNFPNGCITDLKVMESLLKHMWVKDIGKMSWVEFWGYDIAAAIYQRVTEVNTKKQMPCILAAASKETVTDIDLLGFDQDININPRFIEIEANMPRILGLKAGNIEPDRCGQCDYCKSTKVLMKPIHFSELLEKV